MTKENLIAPVIVIGLSIAFIFVSFLVYLFAGNPRLIKSKLKIGAAIITLTTFANTYSFSQKTCYKPSIIKEVISFDVSDENSIITIYDNDKELTGKISNILSVEYYFSITDTLGKTIQKGNLKAKDGRFDADEENFIIHFTPLKAGNYTLTIRASADKNNSSAFIYRCRIIVNKESDKIKVTCYYY